MLPIPAFVMERILPNLIHGGKIDDGMWQELMYSCNLALITSLKEVEYSVQQVDFSNLPELKGTERQISFAMDIREKALRAEAALQNVLVSSKIMKFSLFQPAKDSQESRFWIENKDELTRQLKALYLNSEEHFDSYKLPKDYGWSNGHFAIWQAELINYVWDAKAPELQGYCQLYAANDKMCDTTSAFTDKNVLNASV